MQQTCHGTRNYFKCDEEGVPLFVQEVILGLDGYHICYFDGSTKFIHQYDIDGNLPDNLPKHLITEYTNEKLKLAAEQLWVSSVTEPSDDS